MLGELISEFLGEMIIVPLFNAVVAVVWWLVRNITLVVFYPLMLLTGWLRLWLRERGRTGFGLLWHTHGYAGLHRFGWQEAAFDVECIVASVLIMLAGTGVVMTLYSLAIRWML